MNSLFIVLLFAHILGDFVFQTDSMVRAKDRCVGVLLLHSGIVTALSAVFVGYLNPSWYLLLYPVLFAFHFLIDWIKGLFSNDGLYTFLIDQAAHIAALLVIAGVMPDIMRESLWLEWLEPRQYFGLLTVLTGLMACVFAGDVLISKLTAPLLAQIDPVKGLKNGGRYIGRLERSLIFFFMMTGMTGAIGFLVAAKSILRFGEIKEPSQRKEAEYIIIGTFMSFAWALLTAWLTQQGI